MEPLLTRRKRAHSAKRQTGLREAREQTGFAAHRHRNIILPVIATAVLQSLIFAPIGWWPLSFVCLVPWLVMIGTAPSAKRVYAYSFLMALVFFLINMRWLYHATGWGYAALSFYQALYFPLVACPVRHAIRRRRFPLAVVLPFVWTGSEMVRAVAISGFPWFFLSHANASVLMLIQVSDLVGAYGVSFLVAAANGAIADMVMALVARRRGTDAAARVRSARIGAATVLVLFAAAIAYGRVRLEGGTMSQGPKIAVFQGDFLNVADPDDEASRIGEPAKMELYLAAMDSARTERPDLYLLPETPWTMRLNREAILDPLSRASYRALMDRAEAWQSYVVTGSHSRVYTPTDLRAKEKGYNSATVFYPTGSVPGRYDKIHLVYFGETVPFRFGRLRFLYLWLNRMMPFSGPDGDYEYSIFRGDEFRVFEMESAALGGKRFHFGIPICYEDVMPYVSRRFARGVEGQKRADLLLNISNDGWFGHSVQQAQHLAICVFRAVENRVGIARAVNTGISGFIDPTGRTHGLIRHDPSATAPDVRYSIAHLAVDSQVTYYTMYGDWFGWACAVLWLLCYIDYLCVRALSRRHIDAKEGVE